MILNELRIGNYIQYFDTVKKVEKIGCNNEDFIQANNTIIHRSRIKAIPITTSILKGCGFKQSAKAMILWFIEGVEGLVIEDSESCIYAGGDLCSIKHIKYVHQLQNLYFCLTGDELKLKL